VTSPRSAPPSLRGAAHRPAFTLLEVLLASAIAALLMAALYVSMEVQLNHAQAGREAVNESTVARNLIARIEADLAGTISPITATVAVKSTTGDVAADVVTPLSGGVIGDNTVLTVWASRVPQVPTGADAVNADMQQLASGDVRRISYWMAEGGLARQDLDRVTADDEDSQLPPNVTNEQQYILAPEVTDLVVRYFDGTAWQDSWDGTVLGADGKTPIGPPRAVEITLSIRKAGADPNDTAAVQSYRHVVGINAANAQPTTADDTGTTGSGSSSSTGSSTTGGASP
jgi:prepilin-type N-terminal cleavage/methylation domain-containing protein